MKDISIRTKILIVMGSITMIFAILMFPYLTTTISTRDSFQLITNVYVPISNQIDTLLKDIAHQRSELLAFQHGDRPKIEELTEDIHRVRQGIDKIYQSDHTRSIKFKRNNLNELLGQYQEIFILLNAASKAERRQEEQALANDLIRISDRLALGANKLKDDVWSAIAHENNLSQEKFYKSALQIITLATVSFLVVFLYVFLVYRDMKDGFKILLEGIKRYPEGYRNVFADIDRKDELGNIARQFHDMAVTIAKRDKESARLETQLQQSQRLQALGALAGGVAHDFNNLLQAIKGYTQLMLVKTPPEDENHEMLTAVEKASMRASDLTRQLLTFSRRMESKLRPVSLNDEIKQVNKLLKRTIPKMITIELDLAEDLDLINADPGQLEQVIMNISVNARDAMPDGGRIVFETRNVFLDEDYCRIYPGLKPGSYGLLSITDTGRGMDEETQNHIFEPFFTTKDPGKGTGLGLSIVYGIIKNHNGHVTCYSEPGKGTNVKIYLPISQSQTIDTAPVVPITMQGGNEGILLVDDDTLVRDFGRKMLSYFGYRVFFAENGREALSVYRRRGKEISLVILDLNMPVMDGQTCLEHLIEEDPHVRVLVTSGYSSATLEEKTIGAKGFISKPFEVSHMIKKIREVLDAPQTDEEKPGAV